MCFGGQTTYTPPNNPAPYLPQNSQTAVTETQASGSPSAATQENLGPQAVAKDAQDTPGTSPVNGFAVSSGLATSTL